MKKFLKPRIKRYVAFLLPVLSGILLILAYPPYNLEFLIWIALIPLFWFVALEKISRKKALVGGFITGVLFFGKLFGWLFATAPFEWLGITTKTDTLLVSGLIAALWFIQTVFFGLFIGIFVWPLKLSFNKLSKFAFLVIAPAIWIVIEYARAWGFGVLWAGKETLWGPHWTFGNLAYALHNSSKFIQLADITGIYGISFLIVVINTILFLILRKIKAGKIFKKESSLVSLIILNLLLVLIASAWAGYGIYKLKIEENQSLINQPKAKIALLQTNFVSGSEFNPYRNKEIFNTILELLKSSDFRNNNPDFIIAPEGFGIVSMLGDKDLARYMLGSSWQPGQIYLENQKIVEENESSCADSACPDFTNYAHVTKSRLFYYDLEQEESVGFHDKLLLVPNGDYLSYIAKAFLSLYSFDIEHEQKLYQKGEKTEPVQTSKGIVGGSICSSILSPCIHNKMTKKGAEFLVVVSSDAPFHGAKALLAQNLAMSKLRAIENRRYFAQATNMGYSFLLDTAGNLITKPSKLGNKIIFSDIQLLKDETIYNKLGDWVLILAALIIVIYILIYIL